MARPANGEVAPEASVSIGEGWTAALVPLAGGAVLRVARGAADQTLEIVISLTADGPVVRARAAALEIDCEQDLVARCDRFRVEARTEAEIVSGGTLRAQGRRLELEATHGSARVRANDDVQLLGEQVLLNCDRPLPTPQWVLPASLPEPSLAAEDASGDDELLRALKGP